MSNMPLIVSVISLLGWLALNLRAVRADTAGMPRDRVIKMALAWIAIIAAVAWLAGRFTP